MISIISVGRENTDAAAKAKSLFKEYAASLNFDLCFQDFDRELEEFPVQYSPPDGSLFLAVENNIAVGCIGIRRLEDRVCEMKRLYVKPCFRGTGAGRMLAEKSIEAARSLNYKLMRLDTLPSMTNANRLYVSLGFKRIEPYRYNPIKGAVYMELDLE